MSSSRTQRSDIGEAQTRGPSVSSQAHYQWATALPLPLLFPVQMAQYVHLLQSNILVKTSLCSWTDCSNPYMVENKVSHNLANHLLWITHTCPCVTQACSLTNQPIIGSLIDSMKAKQSLSQLSQACLYTRRQLSVILTNNSSPNYHRLVHTCKDSCQSQLATIFVPNVTGLLTHTKTAVSHN